MNTDEIRKMLSENSRESFDAIVSGKVLGASKHINMILEMYIDIAKNNKENIAEKKIAELMDYFISTRGQSSYAIVNALELVKQLINENKNSNYEERVNESVDDYFKISNENMERIVRFSKNYLMDKKTVIIFDYSSSVEKAIVNAGHKLNVIIPESRCINGGYPFVKKIYESGHDIHFIPDVAMMSMIKQVDAIFIGAETFYPDGTAFNTIGSDILAELADVFHVPYIVVTPLQKVDLRASKGVYKKDIIRDMKGIIDSSWSEKFDDGINFKIKELVGVEPDKIDFYITEKGILRPCDLFAFVYKEEKIC